MTGFIEALGIPQIYATLRRNRAKIVAGNVAHRGTRRSEPARHMQ
jgi:hypothetical protein